MRKKIYLIIILILAGIIAAKIITRDNLWNFSGQSLNVSKKTQEKAKGLNQFYQWTKEDPLFTSPDFDPVAFAGVVNALEKEDKEIQSYLKSNDPLYPTVFLKDVVGVYQQNKNFIANPDESSAKNLIALYRKTQQDYSASAEALLKILQNGQFPDESVFTGINVNVSYQVIKSDVAKLVENGKELGREIDRREHCLQTGLECRIPTEALAEPQIKKEDYKFTQKDLLSKNIVLADYNRDASIYGPYVVSTGCYGFSDDLKPIPYPFYISDKMPSRAFPQLGYKYLKLATTNYYKRLIVDPNGPGSYLLKSNKQWIQQRETQLYMCNDPSYEANLQAVDNFYRTYNKSQLFQQISFDSLPDEIKQAVQKGADIEKSFFEEEFPSEITAANTANYYAYFYKLLGDWDQKYSTQLWFKEIEKNKEEYLTRSLIYQRKLSSIDILMANALQMVHQLRIRFTVAKQTPEAYVYMYGFRTFYGLYYQTFSPSFYRLVEPLSYLSTKKVTIPPESRGAHMTYQEVLKTHSAEEISSWKFIEHDLLQVEIDKFKQENPGTSL